MVDFQQQIDQLRIQISDLDNYGHRRDCGKMLTTCENLYKRYQVLGMQQRDKSKISTDLWRTRNKLQDQLTVVAHYVTLAVLSS